MRARSSARPSVFARRPVAINRWLPSIASSPSPARTTLIFPPVPSTRATVTLLRTITPSRASASSTIAAHSPSSRASGSPASSTVTAAPRRRKAWASSRPIAPAPITIRCSGRAVRSNTVSLVRCGTASSPAIGGSAGEEPVAMTKRRAAISMPSPTATVLRSLKRAAPAITRTPSPLKRSFESFGAIAAMTSCTWWWTLAKSISAGPAETPKARASARAWARSPAAISAFDGTQPVLRHSPPILFFSTNTTDTPNAAAAAATERPPEPAPMTQMSGCKRSAMPSPRAGVQMAPYRPLPRLRGRDREGARNMKALQVTPSPTLPRKREREQTEFAARTDPITSPKGQMSRMIRPLARVRRRARAQPLYDDGNERENTQRHERAEKLRRERRLHVELEPAVGPSRREARLVGGLLRGDHAVEAGADEGKCEGGGNHAQRRRRHEGRERDPAQRRNEVDEPERKNRHQSQKQQVVEGVGAKALRHLFRQPSRPAHEEFADRALGDQEDANGSDRRAHRRRRAAENGAEQNSAGDREINADRDR